jgi:hypothetical protein
MKHAPVDGDQVRHWHVTERRVRRGRFRRTQVVGRLGASHAGAAYGALARRVSELILDGWSLHMEQSTDAMAVLQRDGVRTAVDVVECWDRGCLAARPPLGAGAAAS